MRRTARAALLGAALMTVWSAPGGATGSQAPAPEYGPASGTLVIAGGELSQSPTSARGEMGRNPGAVAL